MKHPIINHFMMYHTSHNVRDVSNIISYPWLQAPHLPEIKNAFDVGNFEKIREEDPAKIPEETSGWDAEFWSAFS